MLKLQYYSHVCPTQNHQNMLVSLFETGCRVSEMILLRPDNFYYNEEAISCVRIPVLKHKRRDYRDFYIKRDEENPLAEDFVEFIRKKQKSQSAFLFPGRSDGHISRVTVWRRILEISEDLYPHFLRSQKARFLVNVRGFDVFLLTDFFDWKSSDTPLSYIGSRLKDQQEALGIKKIPGMI